MTHDRHLRLRQPLAQALITNRLILGAIGLNLTVVVFLLWMFGGA